MVRTLKVILWGEEIGRLSWDDNRKNSYFTYNPDFVRKGLDISPLWASIHNNRGLMPIWGEEERIYQKLPAFLADSLPDAWHVCQSKTQKYHERGCPSVCIRQWNPKA